MVGKTGSLIILIVLFLFMPLATIIGAAFSLIRAKQSVAILVAIAIPALLFAVGDIGLAFQGAPLSFGALAGGTEIVLIAMVALFTYLAYHFATRFRGEKIL